MADLLHCNYIIDGVQMTLSPERMLRECTAEPPLELDGDAETLADETLDLSPDHFQFKESSVAAYAKAIGEKRSFPLPFAASYTAGKVAQALLDAIWMAGHFRLGDLTLKADWKWSCKQIGDAAAFYLSVESACNYMDALGVKIDRYSVCNGQPAVSFKAVTVAEEDAADEEEVQLLRELPPSHGFRAGARHRPPCFRKKATGSFTFPSTPAITGWAAVRWPRRWGPSPAPRRTSRTQTTSSTATKWCGNWWKTAW